MVDFMNIVDNDILDIIIRTTLVYIILLLLAKILGKKQLGQLTFFNYVTGITIGSIAANIICFDLKIYTVALIWWCFLTGFISYLGLKSIKFRHIFDGRPTIVINKGSIVKKALRSNHLNIHNLSMMLREQNIFSIADVEYAILEPNGRLSVMIKSHKQLITKEDMKVPIQSSNYLPSEIIVDGIVIIENLKEFNLDEAWLQKQLKKYDIQYVKDVLYAEIQGDQSLYIEKY
jgi:uncharacterized membrane protein YcaP (DUF421 family)